MLSLEEIRARKTPITRTVTLVLDAEWGARLSDLESRAAALQAQPLSATSDELDEIINELGQAKAEMAEKTVTFTLRAVSVDRYERIVAAHPPTAEQRRKSKEDGFTPTAWNERTFPPALVAACLVDPETGSEFASYDEVKEWWEDDSWNISELAELFAAALEVCTTRVALAPRR